MFPALVHRIDTDTSGLVVAARTPSAYDALRRQFQQHTVQKEYLAIVHGTPPSERTLRHDLVHDASEPGRMVVVSSHHRRKTRRLMKAVTAYRVLKRWRDAALLTVTIYTGVTHQIRCQLSAMGHPIIGDVTYGRADDRKRWNIARHFLHAAAISFVHPATQQPVYFEAPTPPEWETMLARLNESPTASVSKQPSQA